FTVLGHGVQVVEGRLTAAGPRLWLLDCPPLFARSDNPYRGADGVEFADNALRFGVFGAAVARLARGFNRWRPQVVHLHDWHAGLAAPWIAEHSPRPRLLFTIHNLQYQGLFDRATFDRLQLRPQWWHIEGLEFYGEF